MGDALELQAIGEVLGKARSPEQGALRIASVKSNIGHAEVSAGMFSLAKVRVVVCVARPGSVGSPPPRCQMLTDLSCY